MIGNIIYELPNVVYVHYHHSSSSFVFISLFMFIFIFIFIFLRWFKAIPLEMPFNCWFLYDLTSSLGPNLMLFHLMINKISSKFKVIFAHFICIHFICIHFICFDLISFNFISSILITNFMVDSKIILIQIKWIKRKIKSKWKEIKFLY